MPLHPDDWQAIRACCTDEAAFARVSALLQERLQEQAAHSAFLLDSLPVGALVMDAEGRVVQANRALLEMMNLCAEDLLGHLASDFLPVFPLEDKLAASLPETGYSFNLDIPRQDGASVHTHVALRAVQHNGDEVGWLASVTDITAQRQAQAALFRSEKRYRQAVENSPNAIFSIDRQGIILSWNRTCEHTLGYSAAEMVGQHYGRLLQNPDERHQLAASVRSVFQRRRVLTNVEIIFERRDGSGRLALSRLYPVLDDMGHFVRECVFANNDVTEQKLAEERLRQNGRMYEALIRSLPRMVVALFDRSLRLLVASGRGLADIGLGDDLLADKTLADVLPAADAAYLEKCFQVVMQGEEQHFEGKFQSHLYDIHLLPVYDFSSVVLAGLLVARDITQEREAENALRSSEYKLRSLIDRSDDGVVLVNREGQIIEWNASQERITGLPAAETLGRFVWDVYSRSRLLDGADLAALTEAYRAATLPVLERSHSGQPNHILEEVIQRPDGERRTIQTVAFSLAPESGGGSMLGSITRDITEQREAEREALVHDVERERLRLLTEFITSASHEFRTPLSIINLKMHLIRRLAGADAVSEHIDGVTTQVNNILGLVESLLRMSRLDPSAERSFFAIRLEDVLRGVVMSLEHSAAERGAQISFSADIGALPAIVADPDALHTAFYNVLENAVRYTPPGGTVALRALAQPDGALRVEISDTGSGIGPEHLPHIFQAFYRADKARTTPGLGLGLTIARKAVELHGGDIRVQSAPDTGTTVTIVLPTERA